MTYEQFLDKLRQTPRDWALWNGGEIALGKRYPENPSVPRRFLRRYCAEPQWDGEVCCPIEALALPGSHYVHDESDKSGWELVAEEVGLNPDLAQDIAYAADASLFGYDPQIRADLLAATNTSEAELKAQQEEENSAEEDK